MPPKKSTAKGAKATASKPTKSKAEASPASGNKAELEDKPESDAKDETKDEPVNDAKDEPKDNPKDEPMPDAPIDSKPEPPAPSKSSNKRKKAPTTDEPSKAPRRSGRGQPKADISPSKTLNFLLSPQCRDLCRPKDEHDLPATAKTYTGSVPMSPFEELACAVILSRPISHALGQRTIRTLLNAPYNLNTPKAMKTLGEEKLHAALEQARTQHKQKTAEQLIGLAGVVIEKYAEKDTDTSLEKLRKAGEHDFDVLAETIRNSVKGIGKTAVNIFMRRVQGHWGECYPFVDERTERSLEGLGLPSDAEELRELIGKEWKGLGNGKHVPGGEEETKKRMAFVVVLERAVGSDLEGKTEEVVSASQG